MPGLPYMPVSDAAFETLQGEVAAIKTAQAVKQATDAAIETRLDKIESSIVWLTRTVIGAIILAVIAFLLKGGLNAPI